MTIADPPMRWSSTGTLWLQCALVVLPCMYVSSRHAHDNWQRTAQAEFLGGPLRAMQMEGGALNRSAPEQLVRQTSSQSWKSLAASPFSALRSCLWIVNCKAEHVDWESPVT